MRIALIPARGGSKRIPKKNIRVFCGAPMISYSIRAAQASGLFDRIVVSTDSEEIADIARESGALVPYMRPAELSDDFATTLDVLQHAVSEEDKTNSASALESLCCLYATAPFVTAADLIRGEAVLSSGDAPYVFSATEYAFPVQRAFKRDAGGRAALLFPEHEGTRSQDLTPTFHDAGQFYWCRPEAIRKSLPILAGAEPLMVDRRRVQDIDTPDDWAYAEAMFKLLQAEENGK
ncbi:MAG: pseudaminic acid cytidylyltransferase [Hyphomonas sp.]